MAPGLFMFHCATPDIPTHVANGMYGFVLVEPEGGLPKVDKEFYVVQSEFYTQPSDKPGHLKYSVERGNRFDAEYVVFNGAVGAMMGDKAPRAYVDDRIRLFVGNAGPNFISSFHVIGQVFDHVYREGDLISPPGRGIQTTTIPAGGAAAVEFTPRVPGTFLIVDHAIFRLHQGGVGSINVTGPANAEIFAPGDAAKAAVDSHADAHNPPAAPPAAHDGHAALAASSAQEPVAPAAPAGAAAAPAQSGTVVVDIMMGSANFDKNPNNDYSPAVIRIKRGATVKWVNRDNIIHDVKADDGSFSSGLLKPYEAWSRKFDKAGTFPYTCMPHPWMKGTVVVD
jgi:nitrite reductase (NO-forming)